MKRMTWAGVALIMLLGLVAVPGIIPSTAAAAPPNTLSDAGFAPGDIFIGAQFGLVDWRRPDGTLKTTLKATSEGDPAQNTTGMGFGDAGNLYVTHWSFFNTSRFNSSGARIGCFGSGYDSYPTAIVFDRVGNAYVAQANNAGVAQLGDVLKFGPGGNLLARFRPAPDPEIPYTHQYSIDLAADQCTLFYTGHGHSGAPLGGGSILRFDVCTNKQLPAFATGLTFAHTLRILSDGGVLLADHDDIKRFNAAGAVVQTYTVPGASCWTDLALNPDGTSFWVVDRCKHNVYKLALGSGAQLLMFNYPLEVDRQPKEVNVADVRSDSEMHPLAVFGEPSAARLPAARCGASSSPSPGPYATGTKVTLTATPPAGAIFTGWVIDGVFQGWATPLEITMNADHTYVAICAILPSFPDVPTSHSNYQAISQLAARGIIRGYQDGRFGPEDTTLRAQMAALIGRAMGWETQDFGNPFIDQGTVDDELWRNIGTLANYNVALGYGDGTYNPIDNVLHVQVISFITRAMVAKGYWTPQAEDAAIYSNVPESSGHRQDLVTFAFYAGPVRGTAGTGEPWAGWDQPARDRGSRSRSGRRSTATSGSTGCRRRGRDRGRGRGWCPPSASSRPPVAAVLSSARIAPRLQGASGSPDRE